MNSKFNGTCLHCGKNFTKSRSDQIYCSSRCRWRDKYVQVPKCSKCYLMTECKYRDINLKYSPKECPQRR